MEQRKIEERIQALKEEQEILEEQQNAVVQRARIPVQKRKNTETVPKKKKQKLSNKKEEKKPKVNLFSFFKKVPKSWDLLKFFIYVYRANAPVNLRDAILFKTF